MTGFVRPFGQSVADLDVDFGTDDRPGLVTSLLAACAPRADAASWWQRRVGQRTAALLDVVQATDGADALDLVVSCAACAAPIEARVPYAALQAETDGSDLVDVPGDDGTTLRLRVPTGDDLRHWRGRPPGSDAVAMLERLCVAGSIQAEDAPRIVAALEAADPLVTFAVEYACPACGLPGEQALDLEGIALRRLEARQRAVLQDVHRLAANYGWTEHDVLAVSPVRRARYLALIEQMS